MVASTRASQKLTMGLPRSPIRPRMQPNKMEKTTMPSTLGFPVPAFSGTMMVSNSCTGKLNDDCDGDDGDGNFLILRRVVMIIM